MNDNVRAMPLSPFQLERALIGDIRSAIATAYDKGFAAGETVGMEIANITAMNVATIAAKKATDAALGVGVLIGTGIGSILTVAIVGWVS